MEYAQVDEFSLIVFHFGGCLTCDLSVEEGS